jgi:hypothetical protein
VHVLIKIIDLIGSNFITLKIVENTPKNEKIKISQAPSWLFVSRIDVPAEPLSHRPCPQVDT